MKIKSLKNLLFFSISIFGIIGTQNINASMQEQFKNQSKCSWETATYENPNYRFCINKKNKRILTFGSSGTSGYVEPGFLGSQEMKLFGNDLGIYEWVIEGDRLILYACPTQDGVSCSGNIRIDVEAKKKKISKTINNSSNKKNSSSYLESGINKINDKKFPEAISDLNKAISLDPSSKNAYYGRGYSKNQLKDFQNAILDFDKAINLDPSFEQAYDHRGYAKFFLGDYYGAINDYDQAINLNSNDALYFYKRGFAKQKIGNIKGACSDAKRSIALGYIDEANKRWVADMCN